MSPWKTTGAGFATRQFGLVALQPRKTRWAVGSVTASWWQLLLRPQDPSKVGSRSFWNDTGAAPASTPASPATAGELEQAGATASSAAAAGVHRSTPMRGLPQPPSAASLGPPSAPPSPPPASPASGAPPSAGPPSPAPWPASSTSQSMTPGAGVPRMTSCTQTAGAVHSADVAQSCTPRPSKPTGHGPAWHIDAIDAAAPQQTAFAPLSAQSAVFRHMTAAASKPPSNKPPASPASAWVPPLLLAPPPLLPLLPPAVPSAAPPSPPPCSFELHERAAATEHDAIKKRMNERFIEPSSPPSVVPTRPTPPAKPGSAAGSDAR